MSTTTSTTPTTPLHDDEIKEASGRLQGLTQALGATVLGQQQAIDDVVTALLAGGHVLLEGVPGVAKTLLARALAKALGWSFARVQFTPDLMPTDLCGTRIYNAGTRDFELHKGPIFTELLLADEINRTPPKTQAALLEAMEERQVTIDGTRHDLGRSFFVIATQNPLEFEGTYPLPEAQTDRFLAKVVLGYPPPEAELALLAGGARHRLALPADIIDREGLLRLQHDVVPRVVVDESMRAYVLALLTWTRESSALRLGASPRAGLMWLMAARARALLLGRGFVLPDDIKATAHGVLRHRLSLSTEAELDGRTMESVLSSMLAVVPLHKAATSTAGAAA
jgi:MoxR-like ATPase